MNLVQHSVKIFLTSFIFIGFLLSVPLVAGAQFNFPDDPTSFFQTDSRGVTSVKGSEKTLVDCKTADDCDFDAFMQTFKKIVDLLLKIAVGFSTIIFAYAGFLYLTAGGNPGKRQQANNMITAAVVGFFIAAAAWLLVEVFINTLGGNSEVIKVKEFNFKK